MKKVLKVGDRVEFTNEAIEFFFPVRGTKFNKGVVQEVDNYSKLVKVQRDYDGMLYSGHENKWWDSSYWKKIVK